MSAESSLKSVNLNLDSVDFGGEIIGVILDSSQSEFDIFRGCFKNLDLSLKRDSSCLFNIHFSLQS